MVKSDRRKRHRRQKPSRKEKKRKKESMNILFSSHFRVLSMGLELELELISLQVRLNAIKCK